MASDTLLVPDYPSDAGIRGQASPTPDGGQASQPSADTRYILTEIGKLTVKVDRLVDDVKGVSTKVDTLRGQVRFVQGAAWIIGALVLLVGPIVGLIASGKLTIAIH